MLEGRRLAVDRRYFAVFRRRSGFHVDLVTVDFQGAGGLHGVPGEFRAGAEVRDRRADGGKLFEVDFRGLDDPAVLDDIHDPFEHECAVVVKVYLAVDDVPGTVFVRGDTVVVEVDFTVLDAPPAEVIAGHAGVVEVDGTVGEIPPAVLVLSNAVVGRDSSAVLHAPPALTGLDGAEFRAAVAGLDLTVVQVPEGGPAGGFTDGLSALVGVDRRTVSLRDDVVDLDETVILEVDLAAGDEPVAVVVVVDTVGLEVDLAVLDAPPAEAVRDDAGIGRGLRVGALLVGIPLAVFRLTDFEVRDLVPAVRFGHNGVKPQPDDAAEQRDRQDQSRKYTVLIQFFQVFLEVHCLTAFPLSTV